MFEDDPPPLPSSPYNETSCNSTFADLNDHNRITAVADYDYNRNDAEFRSHMSVLLRTGSNSEFVNSETVAVHTESTEVGETSECAQNFAMKTPIYNDSDGEQNPLSSSLPSRFPQPTQISKSQESLEDSQVVECPAMVLSVQEDGLHDMPVSSKERKESIVTESAKDEIADLQHTDMTSENEKAIVMQSALQNGKDDDEFGDFEEFVETVHSVQEENQKNESESWADFKSSSLPDPDIKNKSIEGVAFSGTQFQCTAESSLLPSLLENFCDDQLWSTFAEEKENSDDEILFNGLFEVLNDAINRNGKDRPDKMLWMAISVIEETLALKLQWHDSLIRKCFLYSLGIDVNQTVIRNSDLPVFAQQLGENAVLAPVSVMENCAGAVDEKNTSSVSQQIPSESVTIDSLAVPPVQFDWNTSGLTNPLKTGSLNVSSAPLDLDFLASTSSTDSAAGESPTMHSFSALQKDLTAFGLNLPDDAEKSKSGKYVSNNTSNVLDYILNKNDDKRKCKPVSELSLDARALHDQLPDLDYMLSNVLLFPIADR